MNTSTVVVKFYESPPDVNGFTHQCVFTEAADSREIRGRCAAILVDHPDTRAVSVSYSSPYLKFFAFLDPGEQIVGASDYSLWLMCAELTQKGDCVDLPKFRGTLTEVVQVLFWLRTFWAATFVAAEEGIA